MVSLLPSVGNTQDGEDGIDPGVEVPVIGDGVVRAVWKFSSMLSPREVWKTAELGVEFSTWVSDNGMERFSGLIGCGVLFTELFTF